MVDEKDIANRGPITVVTMLATLIYTLDSTIAQVALPHMQAAVSASPDQINWALTSYIIGLAIVTPLSGWLSDRLGRKRLFLVAVGGFTLTSMMCGAATNLPELVIFRFFQGACGASLVPQSQAILMDIYPPHQLNKALALWGAGTVLGPIIGPALGGLLTDQLSWRWVFYINLPIGILTFLGSWLFLPSDRGGRRQPFDFLGFGLLAVTLACFQLILDRGPGEDWFSSGEICTYAVVSGMGMWMFFTHTLTAQHPFFDRELLRDRQFLTATVMGFFLGVLMFASTAMTPPLLQQLMGYPVLTAGLITVPRGIGMATALILMSRVPAHIDTRLILVLSLIFNAIATGMMAGYDLSMDSRLVMTSGVLSGAGVGLLFVSLTSLAFPTITPVLRPQASAMFNLVRNMGMSVGISVLQALLASNTQAMHGSMTAHLDPSSPMVRSALPSTFNLTTEAGVMGLNAEITRQATMVAYDNDFRLLMYASLVCLCLTPLLRSPRAVAAGRR